MVCKISSVLFLFIYLNPYINLFKDELNNRKLLQQEIDILKVKIQQLESESQKYIEQIDELKSENDSQRDQIDQYKLVFCK